MTDITDVINKVQPIAKKHGVERVAMFGSRARGEDTENSDYDFLISKGKVDSLLSYVSFVNALEEAFGTHVDVVTDTSDDKAFIDMAKKDEILIYEYKG